jgi:NTE family protein
MLAQVISAMTNNLMQARLGEANAGGTRLLSIVPRLERRVGLFDTDAMPYLVDAGRRATEAHLPAILALLKRAPHLTSHLAVA